MQFENMMFNPYGQPSSLTGGYSGFDPNAKFPQLSVIDQQPENKAGSLSPSMTQLGGFVAKKGAGKAIGGLSGLLAKKGGILGKIGKAGKSSPTPWAIGGTAASLLGNKIGEKHAKTGGAIGGAGSGAALGASIGSIVPGIGTAVGGIIGGLAGGIKGFLKGRKKNKEKEAQKNALSGIQPGRSIVGSDPYGQLRAETEARYAPQEPFNYMGAYDKAMASMPQAAIGGQDYVKYTKQYVPDFNTGGDIGGLSSYGG